MSSTLAASVLQVRDLKSANLAELQLIDVRSASEFAAGHIPTAINIPMDEIEHRLSDITPARPTVLVCQVGTRADLTRKILSGRAGEISILAGGTDAWQQAGLPLVSSTRTRWSLERQVRLGAGSIAFLGVLLGFLVNRNWFYLAGFIGCGLIFAGITNFCGMASLLALLPWNRRGSACKPCCR